VYEQSKTTLVISYNFVLTRWNAWIPEINRVDGLENLSVASPSVNVIPKMLHRRFGPLAKAVFDAADFCAIIGEQIPCVFSSANGELAKSLAMLQTIQAQDELSPTAFSLSVHNAIAGLFSMVYQNYCESTVIASGQDGIAPAFIEALGILQEGAAEVLLILYDEPVADFYPLAPFNCDVNFPCVVVLRLALAGQGLPMQFYRSSQVRDDGEHLVQLVTFLKFLYSKQLSLCLGRQGISWQWQKIVDIS
jgi:hypothetical protein